MSDTLHKGWKWVKLGEVDLANSEDNNEKTCFLTVISPKDKNSIFHTTAKRSNSRTYLVLPARDNTPHVIVSLPQMRFRFLL